MRLYSPIRARRIKKARRGSPKTKTATDRPAMDNVTAESPALDKAQTKEQQSIQANADSEHDVKRTVANATLEAAQESSAPPPAMDESKGEVLDEPKTEHGTLDSDPTGDGDIAQPPSAKFPFRVDDRLTLFALEDVAELSMKQLKMLMVKFGFRSRSLPLWGEGVGGMY